MPTHHPFLRRRRLLRRCCRCRRRLYSRCVWLPLQVHPSHIQISSPDFPSSSPGRLVNTTNSLFSAPHPTWQCTYFWTYCCVYRIECRTPSLLMSLHLKTLSSSEQFSWQSSGHFESCLHFSSSTQYSFISSAHRPIQHTVHTQNWKPSKMSHISLVSTRNETGPNHRLMA